VREFGRSADWWNEEHDLRLLTALSESGQFHTFVWIVEDDRPFVANVPDSIVAAIGETGIGNGRDVETKRPRAVCVFARWAAENGSSFE
jgi:hypothetical protein